ncbi:MAG: hypothetical protein HPY69_09960 [Armatimonadetes bacterium]|nr:hypothetical protein [Armatimonadota bacterium]
METQPLTWTVACGLALAVVAGCLAQDAPDASARQAAISDLLAGRFAWQMSPPLLGPVSTEGDTRYSVKDPSVVFDGQRWHVFCTVRGKERSHRIEHIAFADWEHTAQATRQMLTMHGGFFCAPQVFYFTPHRKWYLICQASSPDWSPEYGAAFATTDDVANPGSWSALQPLGARPVGDNAGLDFWVICDDTKAHLFFTTLDGHMWREETTLTDFPHGWSEPVVAIEGDVFEASHTYRLRGLDQYLTLIEAQGGHGWRYYKAYLADRLDAEWRPLAASRDQAFASMLNVQAPAERWTECISHGELLRTGSDERLEVDPAKLRFVFQGALDRDREGKPYGEIPWRLGLLEPVR